jgi:tRNA/rRNA methyltransferase
VLNEAEAARLCVVLVATRNPLNMGAAARAMSNFGFTDLRVVRPYEAAFRDARSAVGAIDLLQSAREYENVADSVSDCSLVVGTSAGTLHRDVQHEIHRLETAACLIHQSLATHTETKTAVLFGSEKFGLSNDDLSHCHWLLRIPARPEHSSMNLGQAVAVCLYELIRNAGAKTAIPLPATLAEPATMEQQELIMQVAMEVLVISGYLEKHPRANMHAELRTIIRRLQINSKDSKALLGMLRQTLWKIRASRN